MIQQSMNAKEAQYRIDREAQKYGELIRDEIWTLQYAHNELMNGNLSLFRIAGLAKAIACFQCSVD